MQGQTLGRLAVLVAGYIRGAHLATFTPSVDMGSFVVVVNAEHVVVSGKKATQKMYWRVKNGTPGSHKLESFNQLQARIPQRIIEEAMWGMLPKGRLGREIYGHLKVYKGPDHPHAAQNPQDLTSRIGVWPGTA